LLVPRRETSKGVVKPWRSCRPLGGGGTGGRRDSRQLLLRLRHHQRPLVGEERLLVLLLLWGASWRRAGPGPHLDRTCPGILESRPRPRLPPPCPARGLLGRCTGVLLVVVATAALAAAALGGLRQSAPGARPAAALGGATAACRDGRGGLGGDEGGRCRRLVREGEFLQAQGLFASRKEGKGWLRLR